MLTRDRRSENKLKSDDKKQNYRITDDGTEGNFVLKTVSTDIT